MPEAEAEKIIQSKSLQRILEMIPGLLTWTVLISPIILSFTLPVAVAYFIIIFDLFWIFKAVFMARNLVHSYRLIKRDTKIDWLARLKELSDPEKKSGEIEKSIGLCKVALWRKILDVRRGNMTYDDLLRQRRALKYILSELERTDWQEIYHMVILATYGESLEVLKQSLDAIVKANYPTDKIFFVLATEEKDKERAEKNALSLERIYAQKFGMFLVTSHPKDLPGEIPGKGGNITWAARKAKIVIDEKGIDYSRVLVTTLDADNVVHPQYFACLSYNYLTVPRPKRKSFQSVPVFNNNVWDVPAPIRVVAAGCSFWQMTESARPERLKNFSSHAQSFATLIDTDFWATDTIVEDGHQYWRTFFVYDGDHEVIPLFVPIYQDAVMGHTYWQTLKAQYVQLRRWAWGISDFPYIIKQSIVNRKVSFAKKVVNVYRLLEGHLMWATAPMLLTFVAWLPLILNKKFSNTVLGQNLPLLAQRLLTFAMVGILATMVVSYLLLPPRPKKYKKTKRIVMVVQWIMSPVLALFFSALPAIDSHTRLMLGMYQNWKVTEKVRK